MTNLLCLKNIREVLIPHHRWAKKNEIITSTQSLIHHDTLSQ
jgi:hypothetical protein